MMHKTLPFRVHRYNLNPWALLLAYFHFWLLVFINLDVTLQEKLNSANLRSSCLLFHLFFSNFKYHVHLLLLENFLQDLAVLPVLIFHFSRLHVLGHIFDVSLIYIHFFLSFIDTWTGSLIYKHHGIPTLMTLGYVLKFVKCTIWFNAFVSHF